MPSKFLPTLLLTCLSMPALANVNATPAPLDVRNIFVAALDGKDVRTLDLAPKVTLPAPIQTAMSAASAAHQSITPLTAVNPAGAQTTLLAATIDAVNVENLQTTLKTLREQNEQLKIRMQMMNQQLAQLQQVIAQTKVAVLTVPPDKLAQALPVPATHPLRLASNTTNPVNPAFAPNDAAEQAALLERQIDLKQSNVSAGKMKSVRAPAVVPDKATVPSASAPTTNSQTPAPATQPQSTNQNGTIVGATTTPALTLASAATTSTNATTLRPDIPQPPQVLTRPKAIAQNASPQMPAATASASKDAAPNVGVVAATAIAAPTAATALKTANTASNSVVQSSPVNGVQPQQIVKPTPPVDAAPVTPTTNSGPDAATAAVTPAPAPSDTSGAAADSAVAANDNPVANDAVVTQSWWQSPLLILILSGALVLGALGALIALLWPKNRSAAAQEADEEPEIPPVADAEFNETAEDEDDFEDDDEDELQPEKYELEEELTEYLEEENQHPEAEETIDPFETPKMEIPAFAAEFPHSANEMSFEEHTDFADEEYDFMESEDAIPIKLDLARAYLEMNDFVAVELALRSVLQKGSAEQQEEAKLLLEQAKLAQLET